MGTKNILLVEDNDTDAEVVKRCLESIGIEANVDRTFRIVPFTHLVNDRDYDLIMIDYHLQAYDAPEFLRILKTSQNSNTPLLLLSGSISKEDMEGLHPIRFIRKDVDMGNLRSYFHSLWRAT